MKTLLYLVAMAGLFTLPQCTKINNVSPVDSITLKDFPAQVGDYWVYKVTSSRNGWTWVDSTTSVDTVTVSVVGSMKPSNGSGILAILQLKWPQKIDTQYLSVIADTVRVYTSPNGKDMKNAFIFPLQVNDNYSFNSTSSFGNLENLRVLSSYKSTITQRHVTQNVTVYQIKKRFPFPLPLYDPIRRFYAIIDNFSPGVGIIKEIREYIVGVVGQEQTYKLETWELLNVHLNKPINKPEEGL